MKRKNTVGLWLGAAILILCLAAGAGLSQVSPTDELLEIVRTGWNKDISRTQVLMEILWAPCDKI